jgi:metallo-beta-lactamase family protein
VGYCAENTLGWKLRHGYKKVNILGDEYQVRARVEKLDSFSGHADEPELLQWFDQVQGNKEKVFLVHGEPERAQALREALMRHHGGEIHLAELGMSVQI